MKKYGIYIDDDLLKVLKVIADNNFRSVNKQIEWMIKNSMSRDYNCYNSFDFLKRYNGQKKCGL